MSDLVKVRRKKGAGAVRHIPGFPLLDDKGDALTVEEGAVVEVPAEIAGRPPKGEPGTKSYDPGEGFLAQTDVWEAGPKSATATNDVPPEEGD